MEPQGGPEEKKKNRGIVSSIVLNAATKVGIVEQTRLAPEFTAEIDKYMTYQKLADGLVERIEAYLQQNSKVLATAAIEAPEKNDPYEMLSRSIKHFRRGLPEGRRAIRKLRRFVSSEYAAMMEEQKRLMAARDTMDSARHDLKKTRTSAGVEEKGKIYEIAVHEFDVQAAKVIAVCEKLGQHKVAHQCEILDLIEVQGRNHKCAAAMITDHLERLGVVTNK